MSYNWVLYKDLKTGQYDVCSKKDLKEIINNGYMIDAILEKTGGKKVFLKMSKDAYILNIK